jgi:hypothetical protein
MLTRLFKLIVTGGICLLVVTNATGRSVLSKSAPSQGPESITIERLSNRYEPVVFSHEAHAKVVENCAKCHHTPQGETIACSDCHTTPLDKENESMLGLKGAYHLQCVGCHRDSQSGPIGCTDCHAKKSSAK